MDDIDTALLRLSEDRVPSRLATIEALVFERISNDARSRDVSRPFRMAAITVALVMGIAGGLIPDNSPRAQQSLTPIGGAIDLAPSTLLASDW